MLSPRELHLFMQLTEVLSVVAFLFFPQLTTLIRAKLGVGGLGNS